MPTRPKRSPPSRAGETEAQSAGHGAHRWSESESQPEDEHPNRRGIPPDPGYETRAGVEEALARAWRHGRAAAAEAVAAVRALLDAASLGVSGQPTEAHAGLAALARRLDELAATLNGESNGWSPTVVETLLRALDSEIRRWEARSAGDPEARAVLRAFLGVREILWEFGLRRTAGGGTETLRRRSKEMHRAAPEGSANTASENLDHLGPKPPTGND